MRISTPKPHAQAWRGKGVYGTDIALLKTRLPMLCKSLVNLLMGPARRKTTVTCANTGRDPCDSCFKKQRFFCSSPRTTKKILQKGFEQFALRE